MIIKRKNFSFINSIKNIFSNKKKENKQISEITSDKVICDKITFFEGYKNDYWPALVCLGIKGDSTKPDHGWSVMENWMISKGFISNGKLIAAHELSDNVNGNDGLTVTVLEFSKNTKISSGMRLAFSQNFKWPEDFFTKVNNYYTWYKSGDKIN